ncbi:hypothetical protein KR215_010674 [Drosophila sulfurigaster]|nr:hypothetical protein KR215_010674 [Drosophila sulfurigaster]
MAFIHYAKEIVTGVRFNIEQLDEDTAEFDSAKFHENQIKVIQQFKEVSARIDLVEKNHVTIPKDSLYDEISDNNSELDKINKLVHDIVEVSKEFTKFANTANSDNVTLIISFADEIAPKNINTFQRNDFYWKLFGEPFASKEILIQLREKYEMSLEKVCHSLQSPQQIVYSLYKHIALTELKAYILMEYTLLIGRVSGQGNFTTETNKVRVNYKSIREKALDILQTTMEKSDRVIWRCDPDKHVHNVTYDEVTRLLQGFVENEVDLSNDGSCGETCPDYRNTTTKGCFDQKFCSQQSKCAGQIHDCQFVDSELSVCQSPTSSNRRYEYIQNSDGQKFGEREICWRDVNKVESWSRWLFWRCSYCFCLCDEPSPKSDRYFSLRKTRSDVRANKVVTGVRFVKKNRVFHIQIQQGQLLPRGAINESTLEWVPVDDYQVNDANITEGVDYYAMSYENRRINLDETIFEHDRIFIVTGVRFNAFKDYLGLKVYFSRHKFVDGEVRGYEEEDEKYIDLTMMYEYNPGFQSEELNIDNLDLPTSSKENSKPLSKNKQYLKFVNTGLEADAGQTTIPFIDIQDVVSNPPVPLAGLGIYYKNSPGYGGFVAPKVISFDYAAYV